MSLGWINTIRDSGEVQNIRIGTFYRESLFLPSYSMKFMCQLWLIEKCLWVCEPHSGYVCKSNSGKDWWRKSCLNVGDILPQQGGAWWSNMRKGRKQAQRCFLSFCSWLPWCEMLCSTIPSPSGQHDSLQTVNQN